MITTTYFSYLLRLWQDEDLPNQGWLASLEDPSTHQMTYFKSIEELFEFIREKSYQEGNQIHANHDHDS
jgi:alpha-ketoglutarate-dependent taurine dioxygenase